MKGQRPEENKSSNCVNIVWLTEYLLFWFISMWLINCKNNSLGAPLIEQGNEVEKTKNLTNFCHLRQQYLCHRL